MARDIQTHHIYDWSALDKNDDTWSKVDLSASDKNFGIHRYQDRLWSSGCVGVGHLYDKNGRFLQSEGKEHIVVISSQYGMDPWEMLEAVMTDEEYDNYISEIESEGKALFKVFYDQPLIKLSQDVKNDGEILYALSFVSSCYSLCKKGLKKTLYHQEKNYASKVRGKIDIKKNIRENTCKGRNDRFYCSFIDFTEDNIENRILKTTLLKCKEIIGRRFEPSAEISKEIAYCLNALRRVKRVRIKTSDFNGADSSGLYMYYKPLLQQARYIYSQKYYAYKDEGGASITKSVYTIPHMINMEVLFEFYARIVLKRSLNSDKYFLTNYSKKIFLQKDVHDISEAEHDVHLMSYCIPDIIICDVTTKKPVAVIDAKYKPHARSSRGDTYQLLSYALLTKVKYCAFVFPGNVTETKKMQTSGDYFLPLSADPIKYYELVLGNGVDNISNILENILPHNEEEVLPS